jgi:hypothetical protein
MSNTITSPNMNLPIPVTGVDPGPDFANNVNASLALIDSHNHSSGKGVPVTPSGLLINANLPFGGNYATAVGAIFLQQTPSALSSGNVSVLYSGNGTTGDLFYNDGSGNQIQITSGGAVNATSSGIVNGTASASFSAGVLIVNAATNTPANIQCASILLGNNVANSHYCTVAPPASMANNFNLTLPSIPSSQSFMAVDTSGNISGYAPVSQGITRNNLAPLGQQVSATCGVFNTTSTTPVSVTNLSVTLTTSGRPVHVGIESDYTPNPGRILAQLNDSAAVQISRNGTPIRIELLGAATGGGGTTLLVVPASSINLTDVISAGTYTYTVQLSCDLGVGANIEYAVLVAYEL